LTFGGTLGIIGGIWNICCSILGFIAVSVNQSLFFSKVAHKIDEMEDSKEGEAKGNTVDKSKKNDEKENPAIGISSTSTKNSKSMCSKKGWEFKRKETFHHQAERELDVLNILSDIKRMKQKASKDEAKIPNCENEEKGVDTGENHILLDVLPGSPDPGGRSDLRNSDVQPSQENKVFADENKFQNDHTKQVSKPLIPLRNSSDTVDFHQDNDVRKNSVR